MLLQIVLHKCLPLDVHEKNFPFLFPLQLAECNRRSPKLDRFGSTSGGLVSSSSQGLPAPHEKGVQKIQDIGSRYRPVLNVNDHTRFKAFLPPRALPVRGSLFFPSPPTLSPSLGKALSPRQPSLGAGRRRSPNTAPDLRRRPGRRPPAALPRGGTRPPGATGTRPAARWVGGAAGRGRPLPAPPPDGPGRRAVATARRRPGRGLRGGARPAWRPGRDRAWGRGRAGRRRLRGGVTVTGALPAGEGRRGGRGRWRGRGGCRCGERGPLRRRGGLCRVRGALEAGGCGGGLGELR